MNNTTMTPEEEHEFYSRPQNQEPQGPAQQQRQRKTDLVPVRLPPEMLERVKAAAADDDRSVSSWIRRAVDRTLQAEATPCVRGNRSSIGVVLSPHVVELEVRERYRIWVRFDDGAAGVVDLSDSASLGGIFSQWSDDGFWRSAHIVADSGAVAWGNGSEVDVCPLSLYLDATGQAFEDLGTEAATTSAA